jgi:excisionase family DNA binding protein
MGTITIQFSDESDHEVLVGLLAKAIQQATAEPLALLVSTLRAGADPQPEKEVPKPAETPAELLDVNAVATQLGASSRTVRRLVDCGKMPRPISLGRAVRWRRTEVEEWIRQGCPKVERRGSGRG